MNGRGTDAKMPLHICLGGWAAHDSGVGVDERKVLALAWREVGADHSCQIFVLCLPSNKEG
jgi:hypothetical protein